MLSVSQLEHFSFLPVSQAISQEVILPLFLFAKYPEMHDSQISLFFSPLQVSQFVKEHFSHTFLSVESLGI